MFYCMKGDKRICQVIDFIHLDIVVGLSRVKIKNIISRVTPVVCGLKMIYGRIEILYAKKFKK